MNNKINFYQPIDFNHNNIIGLPIMLNGVYSGAIETGEYYLLNLGTVKNKFLLPFNAQLKPISVYYEGNKTNNYIIIRTQKQTGRGRRNTTNDEYRNEIAPYTLTKINTNTNLNSGVYYFSISFEQEESEATCYINFLFSKTD